MNWRNIKLILGREVRDQLRDRRTLFMIAVLPVLLYPILGMSLFQVAQFMREHPTRVLVVGGMQLAERDDPPRLFAKGGGRFDESLFSSPAAAQLIEVTFAADTDKVLPIAGDEKDAAEAARLRMRRDRYDAVIHFPPNFDQRLEAFRNQLKQHGEKRQATVDEAPTGKSQESAAVASEESEKPEIPSPVIYYNTSREASQMAQMRLEGALSRWTAQVGEQNLIDSEVPATAVRPFKLESSDVAEGGRRDARMWAKILPFVLVMWALTGAFYPAVDLCAGEKERGTLETLLCSPAQRGEIVVGKLLTVMLFSVATAALNLASMGFTGAMLITSVPQLDKVVQLGPPPLLAVAWLGLALAPISAMFSALSVALAAFARSTKEGQYYLMPLILITMPLMLMPMSPSIELTLGNALIPVTGIMLLVRELVLGNYAFAAMHAAPVMGVTLLCCFFSIRWAIDQFNSESVLFRESERLDLGLWLRHLRADRQEVPTATMALLCGVLILVVRFFASLALPFPQTTSGFLTLQAVSLIAFIAAPALFMTVVLTRSPRETLSLRMPAWRTIPAVLLLAVTLHPVMYAFAEVLQWLYPLDMRELAALTAPLADAPLWALLVVMAVLPAVCEEIAYRGFILSGLRQMGHPWRAILVSSALFGFTHGIIQQSVSTAIVGVLIGYIAIRSGSLLCCILFHAANNALKFLPLHPTAADMSAHPWLSWFFAAGPGDHVAYRPAVVALAAVASVAVFVWFLRASRPKEQARPEDRVEPLPASPIVTLQEELTAAR